MRNLKNTHSLVNKLIIIATVIIIAIWMLSVITAAFIWQTKERRLLTNNLSHIARLRASLASHRFEGAERDVLTLASRYQQYHASLPPGVLYTGKESHYLPADNRVCAPRFRQTQDRLFIETYGTAGQGNYLDSFIFNRTYGTTLLLPGSRPPDYFARRQKSFRDFPAIPAHDNFFWGYPSYIPGKGWVVPVASDIRNASFVGLTVKISDLQACHRSVTGPDISLWLDNDNRILPLSPVSGTRQSTLQTLLSQQPLREGWQQLPGYLVFSTRLKGPGWRQIILYPTRSIVSTTLAIIARQLPVALLTLLALTLSLYWLLQHVLARPLSHFVRIIDMTGPDNITRRLPDARKDELGHIARAYNRLLDTLQQQYENMEQTIAERTRSLEEARLAAEKASERKSQHLTTISHELRTPLNGALGALELLQLSGPDDTRLSLIKTSRQCLLSLLDIINNILDFSRSEAGQLCIHTAPVALLPLLDQTMQTIRCPAYSKGLHLRAFTDRDVPLHLQADGPHLRQILVNLLGNALKFTEEGEICLNVTRNGEYLLFSVTDTGAGMTPAQLENVFLPFYQCHEHIQGTGLGLTIASRLAGLMGGELHISSTPGQGTCASLSLPAGTDTPVLHLQGKLPAPRPLHPQLSAWGIACSDAGQNSPFNTDDLIFLPGKLYELACQALSQQAPDAREPLPVQPWCLRILLVDDAGVNREIVSKMLTALGQEVVMAASGYAALELGHQYRFDLVLMDIRMPFMDGLTCAALWRQDPQNLDPDCFIVSLSASTDTQKTLDGKKTGISQRLTKPVTLAQLSEAISMAAEYQLQRDIPLRTLPAEYATPLLNISDDDLKQKLKQAVNCLLKALGQHVSDPCQTGQILHTLRGLLGQAGLTAPLQTVRETEAHIRHGNLLTPDDVSALRSAINQSLNVTDSCIRPPAGGNV